MFAESRSNQAYQGLPHLRSLWLALAAFIGSIVTVTLPEEASRRIRVFAHFRPTTRPYSDPRALG